MFGYDRNRFAYFGDKWECKGDKKLNKKEKMQADKKELAKDKRMIKELNKEINKIFEVFDLIIFDEHDFNEAMGVRIRKIKELEKDIKLLEKRTK